MKTDAAAPRIAPLEPPYSEGIAEALEKWMPPNSGREPLGLFRTLVRHGQLFSRMRPLGAGILGHGTVDPLLRELLIHRTCALAGAEYEWGVHVVAFGRPLGMSEDQIRATVDGPADAPCWDPAQSAVIELADQLHETATVTDTLFARLSDHFESEQILELLVIAGWYHTIAFLCNGLGVSLEDWAERFPVASSESPAIG